VHTSNNRFLLLLIYLFKAIERKINPQNFCSLVILRNLVPESSGSGEGSGSLAPYESKDNAEGIGGDVVGK
jgi:hypothetical protein